MTRVRLQAAVLTVVLVAAAFAGCVCPETTCAHPPAEADSGAHDCCGGSGLRPVPTTGGCCDPADGIAVASLPPAASLGAPAGSLAASPAAVLPAPTPLPIATPWLPGGTRPTVLRI